MLPVWIEKGASKLIRNQTGFQQANPTYHQNPTILWQSMLLSQQLPSAIEAVQAPFVEYPWTVVSTIVLQHQPVR